jgi:TfoX/Sxy family transcriptional regulator of competence genes
VTEIEERFAALVETFAGFPDVQVPGESGRRTFGSDALKVNGSIFAMLTGGRLVVKLPRHRVDALIGSGIGAPFDAGKGRPMKDWLTVTDDDDETWVTLAREAMDFVRGRPRRG